MENIIFRPAQIEDVSELVKLRFMMICEDGGDLSQKTPEFERLAACQKIRCF
ncbi:hypothetical protein [Bdellovibrio sp. BCCA]|uniref:hypothetical protein n=1 Tax=Bdellovibrio sp. BCCA TaxID=3136281 RepID=UPI0030F1D51C